MNRWSMLHKAKLRLGSLEQMKSGNLLKIYFSNTLDTFDKRYVGL